MKGNFLEVLVELTLERRIGACQAAKEGMGIQVRGNSMCKDAKQSLAHWGN